MLMVVDFIRRKGALALGTRLKRIGERLQADTQEIFAAHGVAVQATHHPLIAALDEEGPLTVGELAQALGVAQPGVTRSVRDLAERGIVDIGQDATDQRRRPVSLTEAGRALVEAARAEVWPKVAQSVTDALGPEADRFLAQLDRLENALADLSLLKRAQEARPGGAGEGGR